MKKLAPNEDGSCAKMKNKMCGVDVKEASSMKEDSCPQMMTTKMCLDGM